MSLVDTHAHLTWDSFKPDLEAVLDRSLQAGVKTVINVGADIDSSRKSIKLISTKIKMFSSIGLHPHEVRKYPSSVSIHQIIGELGKLYQSNPQKVVGVGECGLDYFGGGQKNLIRFQKELFYAQIELARQLKLPLIIHCRDAWQDIFTDQLKGTCGVFHSFTGSLEDAKKALDLGYYLGISCIITYPKNDTLRQIIKEAPLDKLLTETDCPFLPPQSQRGQRNEPANVFEIVKTTSQIKNIAFEETAQMLHQNAINLFGLLL